jgi:hypothetical protein
VCQIEFNAYYKFKNKYPGVASLSEEVGNYFESDPNQCIIRAKEMSVEITKLVMKYEGLQEAPACEESRQYFRLHRLMKKGVFEEGILDRFLYIRKLGNGAMFDGTGSRDEALKVLSCLNEISLWFFEKYNNKIL